VLCASCGFRVRGGFGSKDFWCFVGFRFECLLGLRAFRVLWVFLIVLFARSS
jgi:hypothetical protein